MSKLISRRSFLKGSAALTAGLAGTGLFGQAAIAEEAEIAWDGEYDVVVMGMGFAGCAAAIQAADNGAKVLLTEKAPEGKQGGNSKVSGQYIMSTDNKEEMYKYLHALVSEFPNYDDDLVHAMVDGAYNNFDWLVNTLGADPKVIMQDEPWTASSFVKPVLVTEFDGGRPGYIQKWAEYPDLPGADHMLSILVNGTSFDASYYSLMTENVAKRADHIEVWYNAPGKHLIQDKDGKVIGCKIIKDGKILKIKAKGGVVMAMGGYENNNEMIANYLQRNNAYCWSAAYNDGDGVTMAQEVGAQLWHMSNAAGFNFGYLPKGAKTCVYISTVLKNGILVGPGGTRFMREGGTSRHGRINIGGSWIMTPIPNPTWFICDDAVASTTKLVSSFSEGNKDEIADGTVVSGNTLEELAEKLGIDVDAFVKTVARYNEDYDNGRDADFNRPHDTIVPVKTPPFYALKLGATMFNSQGGARRNQYAQVVDVNNNPIPGLFSAGEFGAMWPDIYNGGGNISEATVFGRIAGENAAKAAKGEFEGAPYVDPDIAEAEAAAAAYAAEQDALAAQGVEEIATTYKDGVYTGAASGFSGQVELTVTIQDGKIADIQYTHTETEAIGGKALPELVDQAIGGKTEWTDAVSGASLTTNAFQQALEAALAQAV